MELFFWLLIGLAFITLLGHGTWILAAWLIRWFVGQFRSPDRQAIEATMCPHCRHAWDRRLGLRKCVMCGWSPGGSPVPTGASLDPILNDLRLRIGRFYQLGLLPAEVRDRLVHASQMGTKTTAPPSSRPEIITAPTATTGSTTVPEVPVLEPSWLEIDDSSAEVEALPKTTNDSQRVGAYREFLEQEAARLAESDPAPPDAATTGDRSQRFLKLLSAFLEQKNIRWGELVGGLLIVGCSLALVISFWSSIAERPFLKFGLFDGGTALLFLLGLHAEKRWRLPATALGLLVIATLLTPLNFLAVASLGRVPAAETVWGVVGELAALGVFAWLTYLAGRSLVSRAPAALVAGVLVPSATILLIRRFGGADSGLPALLVLGATPLMGQGAAVGGLIPRARREAEIQESLAHDLLRLLGLTAFASALALGLLVTRGGSTATALHRLAPLAPLAAAPALAVGLLLWRRTTAKELVAYRTAGTAIAAAGSLVMLAGVALAWPDPAGMLPVALLNFAVLTVVAVTFEVPAAHVLAGACLALAYQLGWLVLSGRLGWVVATRDETANALFSGRSGSALVPIVLLFGAVAAAGLRIGRRLAAQAYAAVAILEVAFSLGLVTWYGFGIAGDPAGATWAYAAYALAALVGAGWFGSYPLVAGTKGTAETKVLAWVGSGLVLAALVQGLSFGGRSPALSLPGIVAFLAHATLATVAAFLLSSLRWARHASWAIVRDVMSRSALATSVVSAIGLAAVVPGAASATLSTYLLWLAIVWLALAWRFASPAVAAGSQGALTGSVFFAVATALERQSWFFDSPHPMLDPWSVQAEALALGLLCLAWIEVRLGVRAWSRSRPEPHDSSSLAEALLNPPWPAFDRYLRGAIVLTLVALAEYGVMPGVAQELTPHDLAVRLQSPHVGVAPSMRVVPPAEAFEVAYIPHDHALGVRSWALLGLALIVLLAGQWERFRGVDLLGALLVASMAAPLLAGRWESDVAAGSALLWSSAVVFLLVSIPIWYREQLAGWAARLGWPIPTEPSTALVRLATGTVIALTVLPMAAMGSYVSLAALISRAPEPTMSLLWGQVGILFVVVGAAGMGLRFVSESDLAASGRDVLASQRTWVKPASTLLVVLGTLPLVAVTAFVVGSALVGNPIVGPSPASFFARIGVAASLTPPMLLVAATLIGYATRERSSAFAFAAMLRKSPAATVAYVLSIVPGGVPLDAALWTRLAQVNAIVGSTYALAWIGSVTAWYRCQGKGPQSIHDDLLTTQIAAGLTLNLLLLIAGTAALFLNPVPARAHLAIAGPWGWAAFLISAGALAARAALARRPIAPDLMCLGLLSGVSLLALGLAYRDPGNWLTYHGILAGMALAGWTLLLYVWNRSGLRLSAVADDVRSVAVRWSSVALWLVVLFAIRAYWSDPQSPWWTVGGLASMVPLAAALAVWAQRPGLLRLAGVLLNLTATCWWLETPWWRRASSGESAWVDLLNVNIIALALPAPVWLWIDRRMLRPGRLFLLAERPWQMPIGAVPFHRVAAWLCCAALAFVVAVGLVGDAAQVGGQPNLLLGWAALVAATIAMAAGLWDERSRTTVAGLYLLGLCASGWTVHQFHLPPRWLVWTGTMVLSAYSVGSSFLWSRRSVLRALGDRFGVPHPQGEGIDTGLAWLVPANLVLAAVVMALAFGTILTEPNSVLRSSAASAALAEVLAIGLLARGEGRLRLQFVALAVGVLGAVAWGWAWITPGGPSSLLDRLVVALVALVGSGALYGLGLAKLVRDETDWTRAARRLVPTLLGLAAVVLAVVLGVEAVERFQGREAAMSAAAVVAVAVALAGAAVAALIAALVPGRDPLGLSERGRTAYVYGSEVLLSLLLLHLRLELPWLFSGFFARYRPLIVVGVAFLGVGLSEVFRRQGRFVLAEPLERTGALLPLLPLLGAFWTAPRPGQDVMFLILVGGLYTTLSLLRSSLGFGALAALAFNAASWTVLGRRAGFGLSEHPQLWVIPPALCVLIGAYLNRDRLSEAQTASIRYAASLAIYLSSTADIVLTGVAQAPWLPLVLGALSIAGVFGGILLRVRGFLFLGLGFLTLSLFSIIWYAAVDLRQTWLWSASGIVAGILILALFALFEKKRQEVLGVVDQLKDWKP